MTEDSTDETISLNLNFDFLKNKKFQMVLLAVVLLLTLVLSFYVRTLDLHNLVDSTTGKYISATPDGLYFLRLSNHVLNTGSLSGIDPLRAAGKISIPFLKELNPYAIVLVYHIMSVFSPNISFNLVAVLSPIIFFAIGLIIFFFLSLELTKSKLASTIAAVFLAFSPAYLFRTMGGVLDHDSIGMLGFLTALLVFTLAMKKFDSSWKKTAIWGVGSGLATAFAMWTWAGQMTFLFVILPSAILIHYLFNLKDDEKKKEKLTAFSLIWIVSFVVFALIFNLPLQTIINKMVVPSSMILLFTLGLTVIDYLIQKNKSKLSFINEKNKILYSILGTIILGIIFLFVSGKNLENLIGSIYDSLLSPFASSTGSRLGSTVSENAQPYLSNWTSQINKTLFWMFYLGAVFMSIKLTKKLKKQKEKIILTILAILAFFGILFSRVSSSSPLLNGETFISQLFYAGSLVAFIIYFVYVYFKKGGFEIKFNSLMLFLVVFFMTLFGRSAARTIFVATPFVMLSAGFAIKELIFGAKKAKDDFMKMVLGITAVLVIILSIVALFGNPFSGTPGNLQLVQGQASATGPAANAQWQNAMSWVRNNTGVHDVFVHWWDYGYLVQTLANRTTVSDGGHAGGGQADYGVGRFVLTTPNPETALSYMKTMNVSYLLIDPTDFGKYPAYATIGSNQNYDRYSVPATFVLDNTKTRETSNGTYYVYSGSTIVDEDIVYNGNLIPGPTFDQFSHVNPKSFVVGVVLKTEKVNNQSISQQPVGVFYYKGQQFSIPLRFLFVQGHLIDFGSGLNATYVLVPKLDSNGASATVDPRGAGIYLSPRVSKSLFAQLYLMGDSNNEYPTITKAHFEDDQVVTYLKSQGANVGNFVYYRGLRGPLAIWKVTYPAGTPVHDEFYSPNFTYGSYDNFFSNSTSSKTNNIIISSNLSN